mgnify:CR=1 FL=1
MNTETAFQIGRDSGLTALDAMGKHFDGKHEEHAKDGIAGLLCTVFQCTYAMAPTKKDGDGLIALAKQFALEKSDQ